MARCAPREIRHLAYLSGGAAIWTGGRRGVDNTEARAWVDRFRGVRPNADLMHVALWALDELQRRGWDDDMLAEVRERIVDGTPAGDP